MTANLEEQDELLEANSVDVQETLLLHATDAIFWLDACSAEITDNCTRINIAMQVQLDTQPKAIRSISKPGAFTFWFSDAGSIESGTTTDAQRARPAITPFLLSGKVIDQSARYQPRLFSLTVGSGEGHGIAIYPSPGAIHLNNVGGIIGSLAQIIDGNSQSVAWAVVQLVVETAPAKFVTFTCQADAKGDFRMALTRLPPLPESVDFYEAELSVKANLTASDNSPVNPDTLPAVNVGLEDAESYANTIELNISPGQIRHITSSGLSYLALQAT